MQPSKSHYETWAPHPSPAATPVKHGTLTRTLASFEPVSLEEIQDVALLRRFDTKMVLREEQLTQILARLSEAYAVLEIDGRRIHRYQTLYFDTPELQFYHQHHNGQRSRYKVRVRAYEDSGLAFLEVKRKTNQELTVKERLLLPELTPCLSAEGEAFLAAALPIAPAMLIPTLGNEFHRLTLVNQNRMERVTLDIGMSFRLGRAGLVLPGIIVAEIKHSICSLRSEFIGQARLLGLRPVSFSKYCVGMALLAPQLKHNHFKPQLRLLDHMLQEGNH